MTRLTSATEGAWLGACYRDRDLERVMRMRVDAPDIDRIRYAVDQLGSDLSLPPRGRWMLLLGTAFEDGPATSGADVRTPRGGGALRRAGARPRAAATRS